MLTMMQDLPVGVSGVLARGTVTKHDYEATLRPMLEQAETVDEPLRLLYAFGENFQGFTPEAAWEDVNLAFDHLDDVERCAVVTDRTWVKAASQLAGALTPIKVKKFATEEWDEAVAWLSQEDGSSSS